MSILIKGMEMPKDRPQLLWVYPNGKALTVQSDVDPWKELQAVSVPPHGRLIDASEAYDKIAESAGEGSGNYVDMDVVGRGLDDTPTIIEAEE